MVEVARRTEVLNGIAPDAIPFDAIIAADRPVIVRGVAADWPLVRAGRQAAATAMAYLAQFDAGRPLTAYVGPPEIRGRFHYDEAGTGMNFTAERMTLSAFLGRVARHLGDPEPPSFYIGSTDIDAFLPGLRRDNDLVLPPRISAQMPPLASIWIGNRTIAAAHHDMSNNIACPMVGRRRFTLFPPDQVANLYPGPLEPTPAGQVVSMVDFAAPDLDRYPRFAEALAAAEVAELEPGDVLVYPALWWHHVEALDAFNVMINYWWNAVPSFMDTPMTTLLHGILSLRDRPESEKRAWRALFDYYLFGPASDPAAHLPEASRGSLASLDPVAARRLRAQIINRFNR
ncbi:MAG TPA: cupin-like domain-containing protein [Sphingomonas sp.]|nr:cupin-like domain-containing protein [Sphingomonas sp.]